MKKRYTLLLFVFFLLLTGYSTVENSTLETCYVVGQSRSKIISFLQNHNNKNQLFCYEDFFDQTITSFVGTRYGAGGAGCKAGFTLINVEQMDCVTFVENFLALAATVASVQKTDHYVSTDQQFERFVQYLNQIRYYGSNNCDWEDRYHYFTDALTHLENQNLLTNVARWNGEVFDKKIHYMSTNKRRYPGIRDWNRIQNIEKSLSNQVRYYYSVAEICRYEAVAQNGDIVALATDVPGLDVSHCGFIHTENGILQFTHASSLKHKIVLKEDLVDYLVGKNHITGIFVFRPTFEGLEGM